MGNYPESVAVDDLNGDGKLDLAVVSLYSSDATILLGNGAGGFNPAPGSPVNLDGFPLSVVAADMNSDGKPDLAVAVYGSVAILLGDGSGRFAAAPGSPVAPGLNATSLTVANLNGDDIVDLAVANSGDDSVSILLGDGLGGFSAARGSPIGVGDEPTSVAAADLNGDGNLDLALTNYYADSLSILFGNGAGGFSDAPGSPFLAGHTPYSLVATDLNGDDKPDLAVANTYADDVSVLLGSGFGGFREALGSPIAVGDGPDSIAVADLNGDGKPDLAVANSDSDDVAILLGFGQRGQFRPAASPSVGPPGAFPISVEAANLNGDARPDLAVVNLGSDKVTILLNTTAPTAVTLQSFVARRTPKGVELRWRAAQAASLLGFNVYRTGVKLNRSLIAADGTAGGAAYRLLDRGARVGADSTYRLQAVRLDGTRGWLGRATAKR